MTTDTATSLSAPLSAAGQDALLYWLDEEAIAALAAAIAGWAPALPWRDMEAMILSGDDGQTAYWFASQYDAPDDGAREAVLTGSDDADILHGREGADLLFGLDGDDVLQDVRGNNLFDGGAGDDLIEGAGQSLYIGGAGNDTITAWGADVTLAFNAGDGDDTVILCARGPVTVSLGLGIEAANVTLMRDGANLFLRTGAAEGMALAGWYDNPGPDALWLQLIGEGGTRSCDLMALVAGLGEQQAVPLGQDGWYDAAPAGGELAAMYATKPGGIEITGAAAAMWTDAYGAIAGPGLLL
ncbi:calcium-binding protein [Massilia atriviolacea]|uniref:Calcium-binding protein n=1 Tax=Massilia atriviolacea TaxID=2495579 RepID=A0A430HQS3_9BURK|nr:calcium-binding protein [Massilia atriviolacea]RSZ59867.1 calcium-binding protein [Massilia atriviolacea]